MSLIEFIGFVISFVAMIVLFFKRTIELRRQEQNPEFFEKLEQRKEAGLREMLRALDVHHEKDNIENEGEEEDEDDEYVPPKHVHAAAQQTNPYSPMPFKKPVRTVQDTYEYRSKIEQYRPQTSIEKRYEQTSIGESYKNRFSESRVVSPDMEERDSDNPYAIRREQTTNRLTRVLGNLQTKQDMIILQEIIGPPKGFR